MKKLEKLGNILICDIITIPVVALDLKVGSKLRKWSGKGDVALGEDRKVRES
jgi:hypothetical protein